MCSQTGGTYVSQLVVRLCFVDPGRRTKRDPRPPPQRLHNGAQCVEVCSHLVVEELQRHIQAESWGMYQLYRCWTQLRNLQ